MVTTVILVVPLIVTDYLGVDTLIVESDTPLQCDSGTSVTPVLMLLCGF